MRMSPEATSPVLGVLGGMGPGATNDFLERVARLTPAKRDQEHIPTLVYSDPSTPDRSDAILGVGPSPLPAMLRGVEFLNQAGCALIAIPCNSAHYWYDQLAAASDAPVMNIVDSTAEHLKDLDRTPRTVGVLATDGTCRSGIYASRLKQHGILAIDLTDTGDTNLVMRGIRTYKAGDAARARELLLRSGRELIERGAGALVIGCTDISAALPDVAEIDGAPIVDSSQCLARGCLGKLAKGRKPRQVGHPSPPCSA